MVGVDCGFQEVDGWIGLFDCFWQIWLHRVGWVLGVGISMG